MWILNFIFCLNLELKNIAIGLHSNDIFTPTYKQPIKPKIVTSVTKTVTSVTVSVTLRNIKISSLRVTKVVTGVTKNDTL